MELKIMTKDVDSMIATLASLGERIVEVSADAATNEAEFLLPLTRDQVPVGPTGQLRLSGRVEKPDFEPDTLTAGVAYGGPAGAGLNDMDVDYALPVHEDLEARHPIGKAKYVEDVVRENIESGASSGRMSAEIISKLGL